jgi:hypothetical protein
MALTASDDGVFFGYTDKMLRLVLAIASQSNYDTPWADLMDRCDRLSKGTFSKDTHTRYVCIPTDGF